MLSKTEIIIFIIIFIFSILGLIWQCYSEKKRPARAPDDSRLLELIEERRKVENEKKVRVAEKNRIIREKANREFLAKEREKLLLSSKELLKQEIPNSMEKTREWISVAESYYKSHTYDPFWNALEQGAIWLDNLNRCLSQLVYNTRQLKSHEGHSGLATQVEREFLEFRNLLNRLNDLMNKGHGDFHFANIYQLRTTRKVLVAGFASLDVAINTLGREIHSNFSAIFAALNDIGHDVSSGLSELSDREKKSARVLEKTQHAVDEMSRELTS